MSTRISARTEQRKNSYKKAIDAEESRRKREEASNSLRKNKKDESVLKRRMVGTDIVESTPTTINVDRTNIPQIPQYVLGINSNDPSVQLESTVRLRKLLSIERNPPINEVINSGAVPRLVQFLMATDREKLQFEAAWALTNIASGNSEQTKCLVRAGAIPVLVQLLRSPSQEVSEQSVWALGNISGDSSELRDLILSSGILPPLLEILNRQNRDTMMRNATWTLSNLCRGKPAPNFQTLLPALPVLARLIHYPDQDVIVDATWALSYLSDGPNENIQAVLNCGIAPRMVELLSHSSLNVITPTLRTIGNIVTGDDGQTQVMLDLNVLRIFSTLLQSSKKNIKKETCWAISNITAGNQHQTQAVISANLLPGVIHALSNAEFEVKKEAGWVISNATSWKIPEQIRSIVSNGAIKPLSDLLSCQDPALISIALEALDNILSVGEDHFALKNNGTNPFVSLVEEAEGLDKLEELQNHETEDLYQKAVRMLETYFGAEEENCIPNVTSNGFNFAQIQPPLGGFAF